MQKENRSKEMSWNEYTSTCDLKMFVKLNGLSQFEDIQQSTHPRGRKLFRYNVKFYWVCFKRKPDGFTRKITVSCEWCAAAPWSEPKDRVEVSWKVLKQKLKVRKCKKCSGWLKSWMCSS